MRGYPRETIVLLMNNAELTAHYHRSLAAVKAKGFAEPISLTADWQRRVDALYAQVHALSGSDEVGCLCWPSTPGMLADGRMGCLVQTRIDDRKVDLFAVTE